MPSRHALLNPARHANAGVLFALGAALFIFLTCPPAQAKDYDPFRDNPYVQTQKSTSGLGKWLGKEKKHAYFSHRGGYWGKSEEKDILEQMLDLVGKGLGKIIPG